MHRLCIVDFSFLPFSLPAVTPPENPSDIQQEMWVSQTPMNWNCYFLIKLSHHSSRRRVCIEYVLCRAVKVSPLPSNIIQPPLSGGLGLPRPRLYTYTQSTKVAGWLVKSLLFRLFLFHPLLFFFPHTLGFNELNFLSVVLFSYRL